MMVVAATATIARAEGGLEEPSLEHGERLIAAGRPSDAEPLLDEAREIFGRLEARPWLERVTAAAPANRARVPA